MKDDYTEQLEDKLHQLIQIVTDPTLWSFLTEKERQAISNILAQV